MNPEAGSIRSDRERAVLTALCDAFHPRLTPEPGDDERLFSANPAELGVPGAAEKWMGALATAQQDELKQLLRLLDSRVVGLILAGVPRGASAMTLEERVRLLQRLSTNRVPQLRSGFQAVRRLSRLHMYAGTDAGGNERGEVFGVRGLFVCDASAFPLSSGANPMITVLALATCIAEGIE